MNVASAARKLQGWQQSGILITGNTTQKVSMQKALDAAGEYTVQIGVIPPQGGFGIYDAVADVSWRVEGGEVTRTFSIGNGASITGAGQGIRVVARDRSNSGFNGNPYTVNIQVTPGARASFGPAVLSGLAQANSIPASGTLVVTMPPNAGIVALEVHVTQPFAPGSPVRAIVIQKNQAGQILDEFDPLVNNRWVPIAANATQVEIDNLDAANAIRAQLFWGVDG